MKRLHRSKWKKIVISTIIPLICFGIWYGVSFATASIQTKLADFFPNHVQTIYNLSVALLYSNLVFTITLPLWIWWKILFNERFTWWKPSSLLFILLPAFPVFLLAGFEAASHLPKSPLIISHRALNDHQAIENTVEAVQLASESNPDYIEIDLWETADLEFVAFHDPTLINWAGLDYRPHDLTLASLTETRITDAAGHTAQIASFDQILAEATARKQKLLIDFKTSDQDSPQMVDNFMKKYQKRFEEEGHQLQSGSYDFMKSALSYSPKFETYLLMSSPPENELPNLTGYSVPLDQLTDDLLNYIRKSGKSFYVWTVNTPEGVQQADSIEVDGIITDYPTRTQTVLSGLSQANKYTKLYQEQLQYFKIFPIQE
ncbi:glycerophosphodiester phosphodiesterase family protein [Streptococcus suis]|uniref:glycerophosphodiester phosphodiesterase family protein n=1 Tax=Streptococcus suis TaxID=1307 RepID=UPI00137A64AC|nr:glycerophosphodiester phosphodiesterase family protein [Streptococcus suis]